jgi:hypothetical protein
MIRNLIQADFEVWRNLSIGYAKFYKVPTNKKILNELWSWIQDKGHVVSGICFELEGKIVGIAHFRTVPNNYTIK